MTPKKALTAARFSKQRALNRDLKWAGKAEIVPTVIFSAAGWVIAGTIVLFLMLPAGGSLLGIKVGGTAEAATSIDRGFADLIKKIELLGTSTPDGKTVSSLEHAFSIDEGFYLVSFNEGGKPNGEAVSPPECSARTCLCVCINGDCQKIDVERNRGRDCRIFYDYTAVRAENIEGNKGGSQLYIKGPETVSLTLKEEEEGSVLSLKGVRK